MGNSKPFVYQVENILLSNGKVVPAAVMGPPTLSPGKTVFADIVLQRTELYPKDVVTVEPIDSVWCERCRTCKAQIGMFREETMDDHLSVSPLCRMENLHDE